jgi:pilus assembly protein CpaC
MEVNKNNKRPAKFGRRMVIGFTALAALSALGVSALAQPANDAQPAAYELAPAGESDASIVLEWGKAKTITMDHKIKRANILSPDVADVVPLNPTELLVTPKKAGMTQLIVWDDTDHSQVIQVTVQSNIVELRKHLANLFPGAGIVADEAAGTITLHGQVHDLQTAQQAEAVAAPYGTKILDLLEVAGGQQIMLKVRFAEVSKQAESELGFNFGGVDGTSFFGNNIGSNQFGIMNATGASATPSGLTLSVPTSVIGSMFGQGVIEGTAFQYFIDALETNNVLRMLAEPDLVTTSGQEATFLAGGSIPYPVPQGSGGGTTITIQWQDYGVNLKFTPIVLGDGRIRLKVTPEVSQLDYAHSVDIGGTPVPALTKRNVNTTIELAEGQTFSIAGLLQNNITAANREFPLLGDLPVLGALFRSVSYQRNETELVILVTPVLVHGMDPADVTAVPGGKWRDPTNFDLFWFKDLGGEKVEASATMPNGSAPRFHGAYGFQPATTPAK